MVTGTQRVRRVLLAAGLASAVAACSTTDSSADAGRAAPTAPMVTGTPASTAVPAATTVPAGGTVPVSTSVPASSTVPAGTSTAGFSVASAAFAAGGDLPARYTCDGSSLSPPLSWSGAPAGTVGYAVVMHHVAAPDDVHWYWVLYDIPPSVDHIDAGVTPPAEVGTNSVNGRSEYTPPCSKGPGRKI